jgi:hypothetical protein
MGLLGLRAKKSPKRLGLVGVMLGFYLMAFAAMPRPLPWTEKRHWLRKRRRTRGVIFGAWGGLSVDEGSVIFCNKKIILITLVFHHN